MIIDVNLNELKGKQILITENGVFNVVIDERNSGKSYYTKKAENMRIAVGINEWTYTMTLAQKVALANWYDHYYHKKNKHPIIANIYNAYQLIVDGDIHPEFYPG